MCFYIKKYWFLFSPGEHFLSVLGTEYSLSFSLFLSPSHPSPSFCWTLKTRTYASPNESSIFLFLKRVLKTLSSGKSRMGGATIEFVVQTKRRKCCRHGMLCTPRCRVITTAIQKYARSLFYFSSFFIIIKTPFYICIISTVSLHALFHRKHS